MPFPHLSFCVKKPGQIRIIAGQWRRRRIRFPGIRDLRPSPDAVRETLFNWLYNDLPGSACLDLYAGSGALGFEAASRGAASVVMVESHGQAVKHLSDTQDLLHAHEVIEIYRGTALDYLGSCQKKFDLVFMDPPFKRFYIDRLTRSLIAHNRLNTNALVYIESPKSNSPLSIPPTWHIIRESRCGMVQSTLIKT